MIGAYEIIGRLFSRQQMRRLGSFLESSGLSIIPEAFAGFIVIICLLSSALLYLLLISIGELRNFLFRLVSFVSFDLVLYSPWFFQAFVAAFSLAAATAGICLVSYVALLLMAESRRRKVEEVLPDFLSLSASNVRAGMTIDQAMWYAAKPEFGILSYEVSIVSKKTFGGVPFNTAIDYLAERFNSKPVKRAVALIKQGMASGGQLADILERTAEDSRHMQMLRKEISASLLMYVIFIIFAGAIGTPFLFAISGKLVQMLEGVFSSLPAQQPASSSIASPYIMPSKPPVSSEDFFIFTMLSSIMTAVFSAMIIGVISKGGKKDGVPYVPALIIFSLAVFFLVSWALDSMLSNMFV
ncbi:MAG: type II secretion system F family protein [Candidatus Micrarchaeota archaeon]|nr:type II secretion system F family protein [Candidatus Micrarchaeota archaeon]